MTEGADTPVLAPGPESTTKSTVKHSPLTQIRFKHQVDRDSASAYQRRADQTAAHSTNKYEQIPYFTLCRAITRRGGHALESKSNTNSCEQKSNGVRAQFLFSRLPLAQLH